jgi:hypothetical protein
MASVLLAAIYVPAWNVLHVQDVSNVPLNRTTPHGYTGSNNGFPGQVEPQATHLAAQRDSSRRSG